MNNVTQLSWPTSSLGNALEALARLSGLAPRSVEAQPPPADIARAGGDALGQWIITTAAWLGLEVETHLPLYTEIGPLVANSTAPVLFRLPGDGESRFLAFLGARKGMASLIAPDLSIHRVRSELVRVALCRAVEEPLTGEVERLLAEVGVAQRRSSRARAAILRGRLNRTWVGECWHLRLAPDASLWRHAQQARLPRGLALLIGAHVTQYLLWLLSWWMIGSAALEGRLDYAWLLAWALLLLTLIPLRLLTTWSAAIVSIGAGGLLKQRLLYGALKLESEEVRSEGVGHLLGRVFEAEAVETLALGGGFLGLVAGIELLIGALVLWAGAGGWLHVSLLAVWVVLTVFFGWRYYRRRRVWTESRLDLTHNLVEVMVGHRTRLAQQAEEHWHEGEDQSLANYLGLSAALDRTAALMVALVPRGWLVLGLCGLVPAFTSGSASGEALAASLGGVILVYRALEKLSESIASLAGAGVAWQQVAPLFKSAARPEQKGVPSFAISLTSIQPSNAQRDAGDGPAAETDEQTLVEAYDLVFRYSNCPEPVLRDCHLRINAGDRLLLEGPSGGGKSTLASLLTGMRLPDSGLLLLNGLDRQTLGLDGWRRRIVAAPQFHENHVLTETFSFNLLMGRRWPPRREDLDEAAAVCNELGLGPLLERMPAGFDQIVGESGWQLSHGERSRLFIARALLQSADLLVLDESFAALDPENLRRALVCVLNRAPSLLVIAHP